jgi:hypothetical protein
MTNGIRQVYAAIFIDAIVVKVRDGQVANRPIYAATGVSLDGERDILGLWAGQGGEGAKFWMAVLTDLRNRGVKDTFFVVCDGLSLTNTRPPLPPSPPTFVASTRPLAATPQQPPHRQRTHSRHLDTATGRPDPGDHSANRARRRRDRLVSHARVDARKARREHPPPREVWPTAGARYLW